LVAGVGFRPVALSDDQKAMLRLLAQREEGYEDMAALMGIGVEELRERVREALAEVDRAATAAGAAAPSPEPPPVPPEPKAPEPEPAKPAPSPTPPPPEPRKPAPAQKPARAGRRAAPIPTLKLPQDRGALIGLGAGALVVVILVIVLIAGGGGDDGSDTTASTAGSDSGTVDTAARNPNLTQAILAPVDGGDATGQALFGRFQKNILLQVEAEGLEPSPEGSSYAVWLSRGAKPVVPIGTGKVDDSGQLVGRFPLPEAVLVLVAQSALDTIDVTLAADSELSDAIAATRKTAKAPTYTGEPVLSGEITGPLVGAAQRSR
jgi:hypothetical protein